MSNQECLRQKIGSCTGCNIAEMAGNKAKLDPKAVERIRESYCPPGEDLVLPPVQKESIW